MHIVLLTSPSLPGLSLGLPKINYSREKYETGIVICRPAAPGGLHGWGPEYVGGGLAQREGVAGLGHIPPSRGKAGLVLGGGPGVRSPY